MDLQEELENLWWCPAVVGEVGAQVGGVCSLVLVSTKALSSLH